jgi:hypothetical protein
MSLFRTSSQGESDSAPGPSQAGEGWMDRYLPARDFERKAFLALAALLFGLKALAIYHFRVDSDETQHAHVVWAWVTGQLQYRDYFDNHMPLFQMACAPLMALFGERADIVVLLRWSMVPLYLLCLWAVYRLTDLLYVRRAAPWAAMCAAAFWLFFYTSTEFRTDDLWAALWLLSLLTAVSGRFTLKRAFGFGLLLGLAFAVSLKTVVLAAALATATVLTLALAWLKGERPAAGRLATRLAAIVAGALIAPVATVLYFASQGAFWIMYYCVILHNVVPGLKRWGHFSLHRWDFPFSLLVLGAYGWLIFRQTSDTRLAIKRTIIALTPWFFLTLLLSYWPEITREDNLPYTPLLPLSLAPLIILAGTAARSGQLRRRFWTYGLPAICLAELLFVWNLNPLRTNRVKNTTRSIRDVLLLTHPNEYVMDTKGDYVFRPRPYYWAIETLTRARMRLGLIPNRLPEFLEKTGTRVCYLYAAHILPDTTLFIVSNYIPFDREALDLGVAGKELPPPSGDGTYSFDVAIPATYALVSESGATAGALDGAPYLGPVRLIPGHHLFHRTSGTGRSAIFLDRALAAGFHPLFDAAEKIIEQERTRKK